MRDEVISIRELDVTPRVFNTLARVDIKTTADLDGMSEDGLMAIPNFGREQLAELKQRLRENDYPLPTPSRYLDETAVEVIRTVGEAMQQSADHNHAILKGQIEYLERENERLREQLQEAWARERRSVRRMQWMLGYDLEPEDER